MSMLTAEAKTTVESQEKKDQKQVNFNTSNRKHIKSVKAEFPSFISTMYGDNEVFCNLVNQYLKPVFPQLHGSVISISNDNRTLYTVIYFLDRPDTTYQDGQVKAIEKVLDKKDLSSSINRIRAINQISSANRRFYKLTDEAKELLMDVIPMMAVNRQNGKVDWNKIQDEVTDGNGIVYTRVMIDLGRVLKAIYGNKDESGKGNYLYNIMVGKPINAVRSPSGMILEDRWQIFVMRVNSLDVEKVAAQYGYVATGNQFGIVTA